MLGEVGEINLEPKVDTMFTMNNSSSRVKKSYVKFIFFQFCLSLLNDLSFTQKSIQDLISSSP